MTYIDDLAMQHRRALLDEADAFRLDRLARAARTPRALPGLAALTQAAAVQIRPIRPADDVLLSDGFGRLGPESRRTRFLGPKKALTPAEVRYLTDVDHHDHEALVALDRIDGTGVGVARYIRDRHDAQTAEVAVTVIDDWQRRGIGTRLITRLRRRALAEGVSRFTALVLAENAGARQLLRRMPGGATLIERDDERLAYLVELVCARGAAR